ncbi:beta-1,3-galactosyltransferase 1-like [Ptychodera flava]|uniref:beta-1,3-galactosyltransferase 1-like n=1 Tax=Ptychodera flava TaxID=63121 RepID=UPI00396A270C
MGNAQVDTMPYRSSGYKWYTPKEVWPNKVYPPYADGPAYVVSMDVVPRALHQSTVTPIFKWEDIYMGVLLQNLNVVPYPHIYFDSKGFHRNPCTFQAVLTSHHFSMHMLPKFWKMTKKAVEKETCDGIFLKELEPNFLRDSDDKAVQLPSNVNVSSIDNLLPLSAAPAKKQLFLCVIVMTTPLQHEQRRFIRMTVGRNDVILGRQMIVRFMTDDSSRDNNMQKFIEQERELYQDMLFFQPSNSTTYHQSTKLVTALRWAATTPADFVMVMDASDYVNIFNVVQELQAAPRTDYVTCHVKKLSPVVRTKESIWYVSKKEWAPDAYPAHCDKRAPFILSSDVLRKLLASVQGRQLFKFPDVFLGILLKDAKLTAIHKENFIVNLADKQVATDNLNVERLCDLKKPLSIHGFFARHRSVILKHSLTENTKCKL